MQQAKPYRLLVVAHPDDETIFFSGVLQTKRDLPWRLICLTDANADGRGAERHRELQAAAKLLGVRKVEQWDYPDRYPDRLPVDEIAARLRAFPAPREVYAHGPLGEYGHPHHQDACLAAHRAFPKIKIFSPAWNCDADFVVPLTPRPVPPQDARLRRDLRQGDRALREYPAEHAGRGLPAFPQRGGRGAGGLFPARMPAKAETPARPRLGGADAAGAAG